MVYNLVYSKYAEKCLEKIPKNTLARIIGWLDRNIEGKDNPRRYGKPLKGNLKGFWRYRIGNYRIICDIKDKELIVLALNIDKRDDVYK